MSKPSATSADGPVEQPPPASNFPLLLLAIPVTVVLTLTVMGFFGQKGGIGMGRKPYPTVGEALPAILAEGWLNGEVPAPEKLAGHVIVLDVWASWCGPCRAKAPELVELHHKYKDRGVLFIGLTTESSGELREIRKFLDRFGITWPNGYGADHTLDELGVEGIPRVWVVGKDGKVLWEDGLDGTVEQAIEMALADSPPQLGE